MEWKRGILCLLAIVSSCSSGRLRSIKWEPFDTVITSLLPNPFYPILPLMGPYHKMVAISQTEFLQIDVFQRHLKPFAWRTEIKIVTLRDLPLGVLMQFAEVIKPDPNKRPIGILTAVIARRMAGLKLPYHPLYCNCYHYSDYATYGITFGDSFPWAVGKRTVYLPIGDFCPLHRIIEPDTNVLADDFELWAKDAKVKYQLNPHPIVGLHLLLDDKGNRHIVHRKVAYSSYTPDNLQTLLGTTNDSSGIHRQVQPYSPAPLGDRPPSSSTA